MTDDTADALIPGANPGHVRDGLLTSRVFNKLFDKVKLRLKCDSKE